MKKEEDTPMNRLNAIGRGICEGAKNLIKNGLFTVASIGTITACLFLFGIVFFTVINIEHNVSEAQTNVGITVLFEPGIVQEQIDTIGDAIKKRGEVNSVTFVSEEEAWENFKKDLPSDLVDTFGEDNPLADSASYTVMLKDTTKQSQLVKYIEGLEGVRQVNRSDQAASLFTNMNKLVGYISAVIIILLIAVSIFLISMTVASGITVRKEEIGIMKLIGASDIFVRGPFIVEGLLIGLIGAVIPLGGLYLIYDRIVQFISEKFGALSLTFLEVGQVYHFLVPLSLGIGMGIGLIGSYMTVRKHLKI